MGTNYVKKARTQRIPVVTDTQVNTYADGDITDVGSYILNGVILKYPDNTLYVTQRPSVTTTTDPDDASVADNRGRGLYYWAQPSDIGLYVDNQNDYVDTGYVVGGDLPALYIVNDGTVYINTYASSTTGDSITGGVKRVYIKELANDIVMVDPENNQMFRFNSGDPDWLINMQAYSETDNGISFTAATNTISNDGTISFVGLGIGDTITVSGAGQGANNATWTIATVTATDITVSETGIIADEAVGANVTIERTNLTALPQNNGLSLADGIAVLDQTMYVLDTQGTIWGSGIASATDWDDALNFITAEREEDAGVFIAKHHNHIVVFGDHTIEFFYDAANATGSPLSIREDVSFNIGCADSQSVWQAGDVIYFLGRHPTGQVEMFKLQNFEIQPLPNSGVSSYLSDSGYTYRGSGFTAGGVQYYILSVTKLSSGDPSTIETIAYNSNSNTWTDWDYAGAGTDHFPLVQFTTTSSTGYGQFVTGEVIHINDNYDPRDDGTAIELLIRIDNFDAGSRDWKYASQLRYVGDAPANSANLTIKWSDDNNLSYSAGRTIDISNSKNKLTRLGRFKSRSHELSFSGSDQIRIEAIDLDITEGTH